ncbi:MAG: 1-acyl-sn-glycerol-3-phosphate acyltransferase [Paraprevotella sp.]|nr:1-acyl-sn-glycerol-3-phosphate acyltransferase [Paraprevotella sp.]
MLKSVCHFILFRLMGWKAEVSIPLRDKYIIALAPHTSNMDFLLGLLYSRAMGFRSDFLMKKEWFFWPLGGIMRWLGGIPVYRSKSMSLTDQLAEVARSRKTFHLAITPEGTRSAVEEWKKGFYYIALKANLPILLYGLDYHEKRIVCTKEIHPDGDIERQMREIKMYFKDFTGKHPDKFTIGTL